MTSRFLRATALAVALPALLGAQQSLTADADREHTVSELRAFGDEVLRDRIRRYGIDQNPERRRDVGDLIAAVQRTVGYTTHPLRWEIIGDSTLNASALPGGIILVNVGLSLYCEEYGRRQASGDAARARRGYLGCLATVIGHEFGHLALGHTENVGTTVRRRQEMQRRYRQAGTLSDAVADSILMEAARFERDQELEADRAGALYILRSGYEVQDAINLFDSMDADERRDGNWRRRITWTGTHPRASERVAMLEQYRGQLKLLQRDFDDALALIEFGEMPDSALVMLDRVLEAFPDLQAARHARAVVLAQRWINGTPPSQLKVRPALPAYDARFMATIRGAGAEGAAARRPAREAFAELYARDAHPYTLSNLAVMEAYDGNDAGAREKAELAAQRMPEDLQVLNNLGVVHFVAGRHAQARDAFQRAERQASDGVPLSLVFNLARAAAATGDNAMAERLLSRYLQRDRNSAWAREATALRQTLTGAAVGGGAAGGGTATGSAGGAPTRPAGGAAPAVAGIELGAPRSRVLQVLGEPAGGDVSYGVVWRYPDRGMALVVEPDAGVRVIGLERPEAGAIEGVRVGDSAESVLQRLGEPTLTAPSSSGVIGRWDRGIWSLAVLVRNGVVQTVAIQRTIP